MSVWRRGSRSVCSRASFCGMCCCLFLLFVHGSHSLVGLFLPFLFVFSLFLFLALPCIIQSIDDMSHGAIQAYCLHCLAILSHHEDARSAMRDLDGLKSIVMLLDPQGAQLSFTSLQQQLQQQQPGLVVTKTQEGTSAVAATTMGNKQDTDSTSASSSAIASSSLVTSSSNFIPFDDLSETARHIVPEYVFSSSASCCFSY